MKKTPIYFFFYFWFKNKQVVGIKKILAPNLLIYLYLHCVKFRHYEKATKSRKRQIKWEIVSKFVAFLENLNFKDFFVMRHNIGHSNLQPSKSETDDLT